MIGWAGIIARFMLNEIWIMGGNIIGEISPREWGIERETGEDPWCLTKLWQ